MKLNKNLNKIAVTTSASSTTSIQPPINGCDKNYFERITNTKLTCTTGKVDLSNEVLKRTK